MVRILKGSFHVCCKMQQISPTLSLISKKWMSVSRLDCRKLVCRTLKIIIVLLGNFLPFHGSPKSREGVGSRTMKTISSCPADSVQPPTDYGDYYCKPKSERWISAPVLKWTALLNGHPYHPCFSTALLFQLGKMIAARNHTMSDALSVLCSVHCLVIIRLPTKKSNSKKSSSKPQKRFFPVPSCVRTHYS